MIANREDLIKFMRIGDLLLEAKRPDAAWVEFKKVEKLQEGTPSPSLYHRKALCLEALGRSEKAFSVAQEGGEIYPEFVDLQQLLGIGADQLGPPQGAGLLDLVDERGRRRDDLEAAIDDLHSRLGRDSLQSGRMFTRRHRPETDPERQRPSVEGADPDDDQSGSPT